jgi:hypothetical protein
VTEYSVLDVSEAFASLRLHGRSMKRKYSVVEAQELRKHGRMEGWLHILLISEVRCTIIK